MTHCATLTQIQRISGYTKLLIVVKGFSKDLVSVRTAKAVRSKKKCHPFECLRLYVREKLSSFRTPRAVRSKKSSSVRTGRAIRSKQLSAALLFQSTSFTRAVCDEPVKKCELIIYNSSKRCLPSPHEFSRYIFCWVAFFAFITLDYRYKFYSRLRYNIQQVSRTS